MESIQELYEDVAVLKILSTCVKDIAKKDKVEAEQSAEKKRDVEKIDNKEDVRHSDITTLVQKSASNENKETAKSQTSYRVQENTKNPVNLDSEKKKEQEQAAFLADQIFQILNNLSSDPFVSASVLDKVLKALPAIQNLCPSLNLAPIKNTVNSCQASLSAGFQQSIIADRMDDSFDYSPFASTKAAMKEREKREELLFESIGSIIAIMEFAGNNIKAFEEVIAKTCEKIVSNVPDEEFEKFHKEISAIHESLKKPEPQKALADMQADMKNKGKEMHHCTKRILSLVEKKPHLALHFIGAILKAGEQRKNNVKKNVERSKQKKPSFVDIVHGSSIGGSVSSRMIPPLGGS